MTPPPPPPPPLPPLPPSPAPARPGRGAVDPDPADRATLSDLLRPLPAVHPPYTPASLGISAQGWATLLRDGDLVEVRPGFAVGPGTPVTAQLRALSLVALVPRGVVVGRVSAAWVHTGYDAGRRVCVLYAPGGHRPRDVGRLQACQATVRPWEVDTFTVTEPGRTPGTAATLAVTTLVRTAMDVATWCSPHESAAVLAALVAAGLDVDDALHRLDLVASWRGADRARTRLLTARRRPGAAAGQTAQTRASGFDPVMR